MSNVSSGGLTTDMNGVRGDADRELDAAWERDDETALRLLYAVGRFHKVLTNEMTSRLAPIGLTISEFTTLSVLRARPGLSNAQLARRSLVTPQAMNQVLASLEDKGLVRRRHRAGAGPSSHHRARAARMTAKGKRQVQRCHLMVDAIENVAFPQLSLVERSQLAVLLRDATHVLHARSPD